MTVTEVCTLLNAGYSKEEIEQMSATENTPKTETETKGAVDKPSDDTRIYKPSEQQTQTPSEQQTQTPSAPIMSDAQVKQLAQALNLGNASIDVPPTVTLDDKMKTHFENLLLGKE